MKKTSFVATLLIFAMLFMCCLSGCDLLGGKDTEKEQKTYTSNGLSITMEDGFYEKELLSATYYLESQDKIFVALKESFTDLSSIDFKSESTVYDYAELVANTNKLDAVIKLSESEKYAYFNYTKNVEEKDFYYLATCHKANDGFWLVQFACDTKNTDEFNEKFHSWAETVIFDEIDVKTI
ncbi:MAG: hypothetical protein WCR54_05025 [Clostridia bacterium]